jgi:hypothetical protein
MLGEPYEIRLPASSGPLEHRWLPWADTLTVRDIFSRHNPVRGAYYSLIWNVGQPANVKVVGEILTGFMRSRRLVHTSHDLPDLYRSIPQIIDRTRERLDLTRDDQLVLAECNQQLDRWLSLTPEERHACFRQLRWILPRLQRATAPNNRQAARRTQRALELVNNPRAVMASNLGSANDLGRREEEELTNLAAAYRRLKVMVELNQWLDNVIGLWLGRLASDPVRLKRDKILPAWIYLKPFGYAAAQIETHLAKGITAAKLSQCQSCLLAEREIARLVEPMLSAVQKKPGTASVPQGDLLQLRRQLYALDLPPGYRGWLDDLWDHYKLIMDHLVTGYQELAQRRAAKLQHQLRYRIDPQRPETWAWAPERFRRRLATQS